MNPKTVQEIGRQIKMIGEPLHAEILAFLAKSREKKTTTDVYIAAKTNQPNASRILGRLKEAGFVEKEEFGVNSWWWVTDRYEKMLKAIKIIHDAFIAVLTIGV